MKKNETDFLEILKSSLRGTAPKKLIEPDWNYILTVAQYHMVLPMILDTAAKTNLDISEQEKFKVETIAFTEISKELNDTEKLFEVCQKSNEENIDYAIFKGITCRMLYPIPEARRSTDEDILVSFDSFIKAGEILKSLGYKAEDSFKYANKDTQEITFTDEDNFFIELHINPFDTINELSRKLNSIFDNALKNKIKNEYDGNSFYTFSVQDNFNILLLHFYKHFVSCGMGIRQLTDIFLFTEKYKNEIDFESTADILDSISATNLFAAFFSCAEKHLDFDFSYLPKRLISNFSNTDDILEDSIDSGSFGTISTSRVYSNSYTKEKIYKTHKSLLKRIFPPMSLMKYHYPILNKHPYLIVFKWIKRLVDHFTKFKINSKTLKNIDKAKEIGEERIKLLKKYGVIDE